MCRFRDDYVKLDVLHKRRAKIILGVNYVTSSDFMFQVLGWERLQNRNDYFKSLLTYKALNGPAPQFFPPCLIMFMQLTLDKAGDCWSVSLATVVQW